MADLDAPRVVLALQLGERSVSLIGVDRSARCDLGLVDDLLRPHMAAKRLDLVIRITYVDERLRELLTLVGLDGLVGPPRR